MTATLDLAVTTSHQIAIECRAFYNRAPITDALALIDGSVTLDRTAALRGRCTVTLAEPLLIPTPSGGTLTPYGFEIALRRGVVHADGTPEYGPLGVFPIQTSSLDGVSLVTQIQGTDRSQLVADARLEDDYAIPAGTNYATAIRGMIDAGVPALEYVFTSTAYTTPALVFAAQSDRWESVRGMAKSIGCELYFDGTGRCILRDEPAFATTPRWTISDGDGGVMVGAVLSMDRAPAFNRVIATGETTAIGSVPRGVWTDSDPNSPTYYFGGFGRKPRFYSSTFITTPDQAASAAAAIGSSQQGVARSLAWESVPNSAMRPGDLILVSRQAMGVNEIHMLDSMTIGLTADAKHTGTSRWGSTSE